MTMEAVVCFNIILEDGYRVCDCGKMESGASRFDLIDVFALK